VPADIERHKTANEIGCEVSIQYFEDSTDIYGPARFMYMKRVIDQGSPGYTRRCL
jgi:hypothetical protein